MKPVYLGGVRGYQSVIYRPGQGWSGTQVHRHVGRQPAALKRRAAVPVPLTVVSRRRPGLRTKTAIIASMAIVAAILTLVLSGVAHL